MSGPDPPPPSTCPNCGTPTDGARYCPKCGQRQGPLVPTVGRWLRQTFEEVLFVEKRLPRSLGRLFWPPGELTRAWRRGRRASYVHPLRLYLLAAAVFFVPWSLSSSEGGIVTLLVESSFVAAGVEPAHDIPPQMEPLTGAELEDSVARADWRARYEERREQARLAREEMERQVEAGMQRLTDLLPLLVGVVLVPVLALLTYLLTEPRPWENGGAEGLSRRAYMEHLVFSTHVHTAGYLLLAVVVALEPNRGGLVGFADPDELDAFMRSLLLWLAALGVVTAWFLVALWRNFRPRLSTLVATAAFAPLLYGIAYVVVTLGAMRLLVETGLVV